MGLEQDPDFILTPELLLSEWAGARTRRPDPAAAPEAAPAVASAAPAARCDWVNGKNIKGKHFLNAAHSYRQHNVPHSLIR